MPSQKTSISGSFTAKKRRILAQLSVSAEEYSDLSPKGSVDEGIRSLIQEINDLEGYVTTSSCAGRVSLFLEGRRTTIEAQDVEGDLTVGSGQEGHEITSTAGGQNRAGVGVKGNGGHWLFVSHNTVDLEDASRRGIDLAEMLGMQHENSGVAQQGISSKDIRHVRFIHFKFEPMILHVLTASLEHAQAILSAALQAGFRESGALNLVSSATEPATPMVAVRSMGLGLESLVGFEKNNKPICNISEEQLETLLRIANSRFMENKERIQRFQNNLRRMNSHGSGKGPLGRREGDMGDWEDSMARRERKRAEGLQKKAASKEVANKDKGTDEIELVAGDLGG